MPALKGVAENMMVGEPGEVGDKEKIVTSIKIETEVFNFLFENPIFPFPSNITGKTRIDKYIDGDDAIEFFDEFAIKFGIDMTDFEFTKYFNPEGFNPVRDVVQIFVRPNILANKITVKDLIESAKNKKWIIV